MKKLIFVLFILLGCSKASDPNPTPTEIILGIWTVSANSVSITVGNQSLVDYLKGLGLSDNEANFNVNLYNDYYSWITRVNYKNEFKKDKTTSITGGGGVHNGKWELTNAKILTLTYNDGGVAGAYSYVYNVSTLTSLRMDWVRDTDEPVTWYENKIWHIHREISMTK